MRSYVTPDDLYAALQEALDESDHSIPYTVKDIWDLWTNQGGFPVIEVTRSSPTANSFVVRQVYVKNLKQIYLIIIY